MDHDDGPWVPSGTSAGRDDTPPFVETERPPDGFQSEPDGPEPTYHGGYLAQPMPMSSHAVPHRQHREEPRRRHPRDDDEILEDLLVAIDEDGRVDISDIDVRVAGGAVLLRGTVIDPDERERVEELAWDTRGVAEVMNEIRLRLM